MKTPKSRLEEECAWRKAKNLGAQLIWKSEKDSESGKFRVSCSFIKETDLPPITGFGEGQRKKDAEHAAARVVLEQMGIKCDDINQNPSPVHSPGCSDLSNLRSPVQIASTSVSQDDKEVSGVTKTPKDILEQEYALRKAKFPSVRLDWMPPVEIGDGKCFVFCCFIQETGLPPITGRGEGEGRESAENAAALECLEQLGITFDYLHQNEIPVDSTWSMVRKSVEHSVPSTSSQSHEVSKGHEIIGAKIKEPLEDEKSNDIFMASLVNAAQAKNYVGMLQEFCAKKGIALPEYHEGDRRMDNNNLPIFTTFCTVGDKQEKGEAKQLKMSKKIAAYKMCCQLELESTDPAVNAPVFDLEQLGQALKDVKIDSSPGRKVASLPVVVPKSPLIPPPTDGETFKISEKVWMYTQKKLGEGGFSEVFKGFKEDRSCQVAIKRVNRREAESAKNKELDILKHTKHPNLVTYYFTEKKDGYLYYVMELAACSLDDWMNKGSQEIETVVKVCKDIALGLKELHRKGVVHRDIKPNNVLIFMEEVTGKVIPKAKLTDFGISRVLDNVLEGSLTTSGDVGTPLFMPPEAKPKMNLLPSFDIFPLGIVLCYAMTGGKHLFAEPGKETGFYIKTNITDGRPCWENVRDKKYSALKNLLQVMVAHKPSDRSQIEVLLEHPFFWSEEECFNFVVKTSADIKNKGSCNSAISAAAQDYLRDLTDWKSRLDERILRWIEERDRNLEHIKKNGSPLKDGWRKYSGNSILQLINFIRDQKQHYSNWSSSELECEEIFGRKGCNYISYFMRTFPELPTLLYNVLQNPNFRENETQNYYKHNVDAWFKLKR